PSKRVTLPPVPPKSSSYRSSRSWSGKDSLLMRAFVGLSRPALKPLAAYALCAALSLTAVGIRLQLWRADFRVPLTYSGDSMVNLTWVKSAVEPGWWTTTPHLGAPSQFDMRDFPANATLHFLALRGLAVFSSDPAVLANVYYVATFPLVALAGLAALRGLG